MPHAMNLKPDHPQSTCGAARTRATQRGFSLIEMSVVLLVIGLIVGAVAVGRNLQRNAAYQRVSSDFVQGWLIAYDSYTNGTGTVPGDVVAAPTGRVNATGAAGEALCGDAMLNAFLAAGIVLPEGRAAGSNDRAVYLDTNGIPQEVQVCFQNVNWAESGAAVGAYVTRPRNVMILRNLTPALANLLDSQIDGIPDARFGRFREDNQANAVATTTGQTLSVDERMGFGTTVVAADGARDEDQVAIVTAWILMNR